CIATGEAELEEEKLGLYEEEQQVAELSRKAAATQAEAIRLESEGERARDRAGHLDESLRRLKAEAAEAARRLEEMAQQRAEALREAADAEAFLAGAAERSRLAREATDAAQARVQAARRAADEQGGERMAALEDLSGLRQRLGAAEAELQHLTGSEEEWEGQRDDRMERLAEQTRAREQAVADLAAAEADLQAAVAAAQTAQDEAAAPGSRLEAARAREQDVRREQAVLESRRALLAGLEASGEGMDAGVKFLLQSSRDRLKSLFIDMLEVPAGHQGAVERALGKSLQVVLVSDKERGVELLSALREGGKGEAVFGLPGFSGFRRERPQLAGRPGFHGWLADVVRGPAEWSGVFEWALGGHALVDSLETAFALASETGAGSPGA